MIWAERISAAAAAAGGIGLVFALLRTVFRVDQAMATLLGIAEEFDPNRPDGSLANQLRGQQDTLRQLSRTVELADVRLSGFVKDHTEMHRELWSVLTGAGIDRRHTPRTNPKEDNP